jgi:hypothetical protein
MYPARVKRTPSSPGPGCGFRCSPSRCLLRPKRLSFTAFPNKEISMQDRGIPRQIVRVEITLGDSHILSGELQIDLDSRLSDFLNLPEKFIILKDKGGITRIVHKAHIVQVVEL